MQDASEQGCTAEQIIKRESRIRQVVDAMMQGRRLTIYDSEEFELAEMHTAFSKIRASVVKGSYPGWKMCSKWCTTADGIRYKQYWFERDEQDS